MYLFTLLSELQLQGPLEETSTPLSFFNNGLTVSLWNTEEAQNKEYKIDYLYKLLTIFGVVSKIASGIFPTVGKVINTVRITGHALLCQHAPNCH
jgi:hypothetical protein